MKIYRKRILDDLILRRSQTAGAILVEGIKWCGKTTTCEQASKSVIDMRLPVSRSADADAAHNISPVEVKSAKQYSTVSLDKYRRKYSKFLAESFVLHVNDLEQNDGVTRLPVYMAPFLVKGILN